MKNKSFFCLFTDICGNLKEKIVYETDAQELAKKKIHIDGSGIKGFTETSNSDLELIPDLSSIYKNKIIFCDINHPADTRKALKQVVSSAKNHGFEVMVGAEIEFYLFRKNAEKIETNIRDSKSYMGACSLRVHDIIAKISKKLNELNIELESIHHEASKNQYEINFKFGNPVKIADEIMLIKQSLKQVAEKNNCYVSFMPKPFANSAGSGMHINLSVYKNGRNLFSFNNSANTLEHFASGIMNHIKGITAVTCPSINSYKRLNAGTECPNKIFMSSRDRTALIRVPKANGNSARIEVRSPDISCNPYLSFAMLLEAGINGILNKENCTAQSASLSNVDTDGILAKEQHTAQNSPLPQTLSEAVLELKTDTFLTSKFPEITRKYAKLKENEINDFNQFITNFELQQYF